MTTPSIPTETASLPAQALPREATPPAQDALLRNLAYLWCQRARIARTVAAAVLLSATVAFLLPLRYRSTAHIMPPQPATGGAAMLATLAGKGGSAGNLAGLAGGLLSGRSNGALFINLLRSGTIAGNLIQRFGLQHVYRKRYVEDTARRLANKTFISEDAKSGVITLTVEDNDRARARDLTAAYLDELNALIVRVNTSSARLERQFIEQRLVSVGRDLQQAQAEMSSFASQNTAIDIKEQTRASVEAGARLQGQLIASEGEIDSLGQVYGNDNVRVRAASARVALLRRELSRASGEASSESAQLDSQHPYPSLRQLPRLAVPWANLYRRVRIQETVFEMLSAQYETARIEEAKSIPTVSIIDAPGLPEKKYSPHRLWIIVISTAAVFVLYTLLLLMQRSWRERPQDDYLRLFLHSLELRDAFRPAKAVRP